MFGERLSGFLYFNDFYTTYCILGVTMVQYVVLREGLTEA